MGGAALPESLREALPLRLGVLLLVAVTLFAAKGLVSWDDLAAGRGLDTDDYLRLHRVQVLWDGGDWFDPVLHRVDPPDGLAHHWTRPSDGLLLAGAAALAPVTGFEDGLWLWALVLPPLLGLAAALSAVWAATPLLPAPGNRLAGLLLLFQPIVLSYFHPARVDYHGLLMVLGLLGLGATIRLFRAPSAPKWAILTGLLHGLAMWVCVEALAPVLFTAIGLFLGWMTRGGAFARAALLHGLALLGSLALFLLIERGGEAFRLVAYDTPSAAYLTLFALANLLWAVLVRISGRARTAGARLRGAVPGGALTLAAIAWTVPGFFTGPLTGMDPLMQTLWVDRVSELQPLIPPAGAGDRDWAGILANAVSLIGLPLLVLPLALRRLARSDAADRPLWLFLTLALAGFTILAFVHMRWSMGAVVVATPMAARFFTDGIVAATTALAGVGRRIAASVLMLVAAFLVPGATGALELVAPPPDRAVAEGCNIKALSHLLADPDGLGARPLRVMAFLDLGPQLLYRTPHRVYAIPEHRPQAGFAATLGVMRAADDGEAENRLRTAGVDLIVLCPPIGEWALYRDPGHPERPLFYDRLLADPPPFVTRLPLPEAAGAALRLFRVDPGDPRPKM